METGTRQKEARAHVLKKKSPKEPATMTKEGSRAREGLKLREGLMPRPRMSMDYTGGCNAAELVVGWGKPNGDYKLARNNKQEFEKAVITKCNQKQSY
ncbi:hypothetical protein NDU88_003287 [Pleurodeles waltl]|uniref:Uncharacterized protein n=1 Tax=Pleurodeles waltl TaxID=8319 RepID=A0AAV7SE28_PLEWA|nr:hypothetical protein NDU88_003287 [Pleurodeles waltl]